MLGLTFAGWLIAPLMADLDCALAGMAFMLNSRIAARQHFRKVSGLCNIKKLCSIRLIFAP
ncbi:MAG: hypothetical protein AB1403_25495, partial [Candidatus Riflebacteria bacterium]